MASITPDPNSTRPPAFGERVVFATYGGRMYARAWPRKVGPSPLPYQRETVQRFIDANKLAKICAPEQIIEAMKATKRTGLYPRDLLTKAMLTGLFDIVLPDGQIVTRAPLTYEVPVFTGFSIYRSAAFALAANTNTNVPFDTALLNAVGLWNPASPTLITVPTGVTVMQFDAQAQWEHGGSNFFSAVIRNVTTGATWANNGFITTVTHRLTPNTGPIPVLGGQQFALELRANAVAALNVGAAALRFSGSIIG